MVEFVVRYMGYVKDKNGYKYIFKDSEGCTIIWETDINKHFKDYKLNNPIKIRANIIKRVEDVIFISNLREKGILLDLLSVSLKFLEGSG